MSDTLILGMSPMVFFGLIASAVLLFAFAMLNLGKWTPDSYAYQFSNFAGAAFLAASAFSPLNLGVFLTELIWSLLGLYGIIKIYRRRKRADQPTQPQTPSASQA
ncbi:CBU_0592 family membrane protein [Corynebacterium cystitidis]|uniref:CBU_0592 family membrane protein n=1 Tax=Corynebacterium cystitidis TaxID=35757 RepID=UPI00211DE48D|nr:transporter [Corynebacterium cystitidis]